MIRRNQPPLCVCVTVCAKEQVLLMMMMMMMMMMMVMMMMMIIKRDQPPCVSVSVCAKQQVIMMMIKRNQPPLCLCGWVGGLLRLISTRHHTLNHPFTHPSTNTTTPHPYPPTTQIYYFYGQRKSNLLDSIQHAPPPYLTTHPPTHPPTTQIYYVYGQRKSGDVAKSYQMGFGPADATYPRNPHHRATSCDDTGTS